MTYSSAYAPGPSPRWGEGKVKIRFYSLAPLLGETGKRLRSVKNRFLARTESDVAGFQRRGW